MESLILREDPVTLTSQLHSLEAGEVFVTDAIAMKDGDNLGVPGVRIFYKITMNSDLPGPGANLAFYILFGDDDSQMDAGISGTNYILDGASTPTAAEFRKQPLTPLHIVELVNEVDLVYQGSLFVPLDAAGSWSLAIENNSLADMSTTFGDHLLTYVTSRFSSS